MCECYANNATTLFKRRLIGHIRMILRPKSWLVITAFCCAQPEQRCRDIVTHHSFFLCPLRSSVDIAAIAQSVSRTTQEAESKVVAMILSNFPERNILGFSKNVINFESGRKKPTISAEITCCRMGRAIHKEFDNGWTKVANYFMYSPEWTNYDWLLGRSLLEYISSQEKKFLERFKLRAAMVSIVTEWYVTYPGRVTV